MRIVSSSFDKYPGPAWQVQRDNGEVLCRMGFVPRWEGQVAWAWFQLENEPQQNELRGIIRHIRKVIDESKYPRIETSVKRENSMHADFAEACGFRVESLAAKYGPDGSDHYIYTIIRDL